MIVKSKIREDGVPILYMEAEDECDRDELEDLVISLKHSSYMARNMDFAGNYNACDVVRRIRPSDLSSDKSTDEPIDNISICLLLGVRASDMVLVQNAIRELNRGS